MPPAVPGEPPDPDPGRPPTEPDETRPLTEPHPSRLPADHPGRQRILDAHAAALARGEAGYLDPATGLFVLTAATLLERSECCQSGCRHCPYLI
ncbi:MAG TPA: DUF5522 domain-containing protein [Acidimicrobiales bacterium]